MEEQNTKEVYLTNLQALSIKCMMPKNYRIQKVIQDKVIKKLHTETTMNHLEHQDTQSQVSQKSINPVQSRRVLRQKQHVNSELQYFKRENQCLLVSQQIQQLSEQMKKCLKLLESLKKSANAWPFLQPVDPVKLKIPDYFDIVKEPMDISTVENNLIQGIYKTPYQFEQDMKKIWNNSFLYNPQYSQIHQITLKIKEEFEELFRNRDKKDLDQQIDKKTKKMIQNLKKLPELVQQYYSKNQGDSNQDKNEGMQMEQTKKDLVYEYLEGIPECKLENILYLAQKYDESNIINQKSIKFNIDLFPRQIQFQILEHLESIHNNLEKQKQMVEQEGQSPSSFISDSSLELEDPSKEANTML